MLWRGYGFVSLPSLAFSQAPFYQDKTITIIQGREPGALGDNRVRALVPFLRKYIPGNPAIVSEFMPGGGGRKGTNHVFRVARPDGLTIGNVGSGLVANAVLGEPGVEYDLDKLIYLGSPNSVTQYLFLSKKEVGLNDLEKLRSRTGLGSAAKLLATTYISTGDSSPGFSVSKNRDSFPAIRAQSLTWL